MPTNGPGLPPPGWPGNQWVPSPLPIRQRRGLLGVCVVLAIVLSAAALVVGIVALVHQPATSTSATPTSSAAGPVGDTSAADKALCEKVGPLLRESLDTGKSFVALGNTGTPERDAGISGYRASVHDWTERIQSTLDRNTIPSRYLTRTLQSYIDLNQLYADNIRPGPEKPTDSEAWDAASIAFGGPLETCRALGVTW